MINRVRFRLDISYTDYLAYYQGVASGVQACALDGRIIHFPAQALRPFVSHDGIHGLFEISYDVDNKFIDLIKFNESGK